MNDVFFSEEALRRAAVSVRQSMLDSMPLPSQCTHEFSPGFQEKMERLVSGERRRKSVRKAMRRVAMFFLAVLVSAGAWLTVNAEAREAFFSWVRDTYTGAHVYRFFGEPAGEALPAYGLSWIPEGYEEVNVRDDGETFIALYQRDDGESHSFFEFRYFFVQHDRYIGMLTEETEHTSLTVNGMQADLYQAVDPDAVSDLILIDEDAGIAFQIEGVLDRSVLLRIAESIVLTDPT